MSIQELYPPRLPEETAMYEDDPFNLGEIGESQLVEVSSDFLPHPKDLVFKSRQKVTITLDQSSIDFFKNEAAKLKVPYQRMIRNLLNEYVSQHRDQASP